MKISTEQIVALQESIARRKTQGSDAGEFANILQQSLDSRQAQGVASEQRMQNLESTTGMAGLEQVIGVGSAYNAGKERFAAELDNLLGAVEDFAANLASGNKADLRLAHAQLESMTSKLEALKQSLPDMAQESPDLVSIYNELDALTTTERFKFNRGDYL